MNDKPESIWKKTRSTSRSFRVWLILIATSALIIAIVSDLAGILPNHNEGWDWFPACTWLAIVSVISATVFLWLWIFVRWLCYWRNFKRFLLGVACLVALIALFYAEEDWRGKHDWEKFKRQWEAKGERFDTASVIPPAVPDHQNFAMAPVFDVVDKLMSRKWLADHKNPHYGKDGDFTPWDTNIVDRLDIDLTYNYEPPPTNGIGNWQSATMSNLKAWQDYYLALAAKTNEFSVALRPQTPAQDVLLALSRYDSTIEALREASRRPDSRFPLDYDDENPAEILLPHLADLRRCSQVLQLRALAELQNGQSDKALFDVKLILYLANAIRTEPILISHLVRVAIVNSAIQPIWEGLAEHKWSEAQLVELNSELAKLDLLSGYRTAMRGEMVLCQGGIFDYLRHHPEQLPGLFAMSDTGNSSPPIPARIVARLTPGGWLYQNQLYCTRLMVEFYLPSAEVDQKIVSPATVRRADAALEAETRNTNPYNVIEKMLMPALGGAIKKFAHAQESVDLARVAIALERYRLAHGEYPGSLDALAPQFIKEIPHDIINGQPLHYRQTIGGRFLLYSVGWNETDDGGEVAFHEGSSSYIDINQGDWVWRYPAK